MLVPCTLLFRADHTCSSFVAGLFFMVTQQPTETFVDGLTQDRAWEQVSDAKSPNTADTEVCNGARSAKGPLHLIPAKGPPVDGTSVTAPERSENGWLEHSGNGLSEPSAPNGSAVDAEGDNRTAVGPAAPCLEPPDCLNEAPEGDLQRVGDAPAAPAGVALEASPATPGRGSSVANGHGAAPRGASPALQTRTFDEARVGNGYSRPGPTHDDAYETAFLKFKAENPIKVCFATCADGWHCRVFVHRACGLPQWPARRASVLKGPSM